MTLHHSARCILITGATGGIGGALAPAYAAPGVTLILQGRRLDRLEEMAAQCRALGARVLLQPLDVQDLEALRRWISEISESEAPDLIIVGAGVNTSTGDNGEGEVWELSQALIEINVLAALATVQAALPFMRAQVRADRPVQFAGRLARAARHPELQRQQGGDQGLRRSHARPGGGGRGEDQRDHARLRRIENVL